LWTLAKCHQRVKEGSKAAHGWSKPKIISVIFQMCRSKEKLNYATRRHGFPALVSAAEVFVFCAS
jgi:hypothetical protein